MPAVETIRRPVAITHKQVGAGHVFQHEGEVFAAGQRPGLRVDLVGPDQFHGHLPREIRLRLRVHQHGIAAAVVDRRLHLVAGRLVMDKLGDARLQRVAHAAVKRADAELERCGLGNDIVGAAGIERADSNHRHVQRIDIAGDDALQPHHDGGTRHDGVGGAVRHGAVSAHAFQHDGHVVRGRHGGAVAQ
ncbi:hypothetical protein G6F35_013571 [Rhizopus arrhizus]|nr:hypothetical protein G6F35_013571 [Rhizopus arrhizus]